MIRVGLGLVDFFLLDPFSVVLTKACAFSGDHQEEEAPFGMIISLNPKNKSAIIPKKGMVV